MRKAWLSLAAVPLAALLAGGCATANAIKSAQASFDKARAATGEKKSFEYYAAEYYLDFAKHESDEGDGKTARRFAGESEKYSAQVLEKAKGGAK